MTTPPESDDGDTEPGLRAGRTLVLCASTTTLVFLGLAFSTQLLGAGLCMVLLGVIVATWTVVTVTLHQRLVPNNMLGGLPAHSGFLAWP